MQQRRHGVLRSVAAGIFLALTLSLATEISTRFLRPGPDRYGALGTIVQALLALLAGGAFSRLGEGWLNRVPGSVAGVKGEALASAKLILSLLAFGAVLGFHFSLPLIARWYNNRGVLFYRDQKLVEAADSFRRGLSLKPEYAEAHFNLAVLLEDLREYDKAASEYAAAIGAQPDFLQAHINLGRLLLLQGKDLDRALEVLDKASAEPNKLPDAHDRYNLLKNRGWARLRLGFQDLAKVDLDEAIATNPEGASAYCLLAEVWEKAGDKKRALRSWERCLALAPGERGFPAVWRLTAESQLRKDQKK